jgi:tripartite ATP-independent transporter DctM subunit
MIVAAFLVVMLLVMGGLILTGHAPSEIPLPAILSLIGIFAFLFSAGVYIAATLAILGLLAGFVFSNRPFWLFIGPTAWNTSSNYVLIAVPLFLLMGEILLRSGVSEKLYKTLGLWVNRLPGGLLHANIVSSGVFATVCGSSIATAATMGSVALPYFEKTHYDKRMVLGSLAAGGALGNLFPPGITLIIYGLLTETSVGKLYIASLLPGIMVMLLCMAVVVVHGLRNKTLIGEPAIPLSERLRALVHLLPSVGLIVLVLGSIYGGLATPTEAAALGVTGATLYSACNRTLSLRMMHACVIATGRKTAMIGLILLGAFLLSYILTSLRLPQIMTAFVAGLPLPAWAVMSMIIFFYFALGTFMEGFAMVITTIPVVFPIVKALGYDPLWFGVIVTLLIEATLITPPEGTILYILQGLRPTPGPISDVFAGVTRFVAMYLLAVALMMVFPQIALWLPHILN